jgi:TolB-like protein
MSSGAERIERKLAAIFCADVADYSRLMHADEVQTLRTLTAHRAIMDGLIAQRGGRIANTAGDSVLAEFPSVVDAVECAVAVQGQLGQANARVSDEKALRFRIAVHVGDVMVRGGDLLGDGVNVAARVQSLADPGGVWISGRAYDEIEGKIDRSFEDRGEQQVKNIARPVRVYALTGAARSSSEPKALPLPDKPSIAILPFTNMGGAEEDYFCDGLVEDIITALSRVRSLFVIARNSSFTYKGRAVDIRAVGRELGVRYVLEGSVRRAGNRVRVTGQLIEARTGNHLWAERFEGNAEDIFDLQDRVTASVVGAIAPQLEQAEIERAKRKDPTRLDAYDMLLRAKAALQRTRANSEGVTDALRLLSGALDLDPAFAAAYGLAARCYTIRKGQNWTENPSEEVARTFELARQAIEFGADDAVALADAGWALAYGVCDLEAGTTVLERALAIDSNLAIGWLFSGWLKTWAGIFGEQCASPLVTR